LSAPPLHDAAKLRAWREDAGLSKEQVCAAFHTQGYSLSYPWLSALEHATNARQPSVRLLAALAEFYGHQPAELMLPVGAAA
jgi:transcriptional regulator with XRE-family HTH domain